MTEPITELDSEKAVLTACLTDHSHVSRCLRVVLPDDFYDRNHSLLFQSFADLDGDEWDPVKVAREIRRTAGEDAAREAIRVMVTLGADPTVADVLGHARAIVEASKNRRLIDLLKQATVAAMLRRPDEALEIMAGADRLDRLPLEVQSLQGIMHNAYTIAQQPRAKTALTWGHYQLDEMTGGIHPSDVIIVAGDTNEGKSSMAISVTDENLSRGARVMIVSLEDGAGIFGNRFLARRAKVNAKSLRDHRINDCDHSKLSAAVQSAPDVPFFLHCEDMPWEQVSVAMEQAMVRYQIDLVVLDYIQECWCKKAFQSRQLELQAVARRFRAIMRKRNRAGMILSQLTGAEKGKPPNNSHIRECKDIVNGAEQALYLFTMADGNKMANLDKAKNGTKGLIELKWNSDSASYEAVTPVDEALAWADERYDGFTGTLDDVCDAIGAR